MKQFGDLLAGLVQRRRDDVIRLFAGELDDVLAQIGFDRFDAVVFQMLVEMDFFGGHRLRFHDQLDAAIVRQIADEVARFRAVVRPDHFAAARDDVALQFLQIVVQMIQRVLLDIVRVLAQDPDNPAGLRPTTVLRRSSARRAGGRINGELELGIGERFLNLCECGLSLSYDIIIAKPGLRQVHGPDLRSRPAERALDLHQATGIDGDDRIRAGAHNRIDFGARHRAGNIGELDGKSSAEAAAFLGGVHFDQLQSADVASSRRGASLIFNSRSAWQLS